MKIKIKRFGLPYNPGKERRVKNRTTKHIILFLCLFIVIAVMLAVGFEIKIYSFSCIMHIITLLFVEGMSVLDIEKKLNISYELIYAYSGVSGQ